MTKVCSKCKIEKLFEGFYKSKKGKFGIESQCKKCRDAYQINLIRTNSDYRTKRNTRSKKFRKENRLILNKKSKKASKERRLNKPEQVRNSRLMTKYGIGSLEWDEMFKNQSGKCAICGKHQSEFKKRLAVDHNHKTKQVRALLCSYCNFWRVGKLNKKWAKAVYEYLCKYDKEPEI